jgi:acetyltransferase-like isoleucine patch superfamily enzyme
MSAPGSIKLAPTAPVDPRVRRQYTVGYVIQMWISLIPMAFLFYFLFSFPPNKCGLIIWLPMPMIVYLMLMPGCFLLIYYVTVVWTAIITKIWIGILNLRCPPKEGVFTRSLEDKDYVYWNRRNLARGFLLWLLYTPPFPWFRTFFTFRFFGVKIGKNAVVHDCWMSWEFVEIGNNVKIGQGSGVYSYVFEANKLVVAKVRIEDDVIVGPRTVVFPGTVIHKNTTVSCQSTVLAFSELDENSIYFGVPVEKIRQKSPDED